MKALLILAPLAAALAGCSYYNTPPVAVVPAATTTPSTVVVPAQSAPATTVVVPNR